MPENEVQHLVLEHAVAVIRIGELRIPEIGVDVETEAGGATEAHGHGIHGMALAYDFFVHAGQQVGVKGFTQQQGDAGAGYFVQDTLAVVHAYYLSRIWDQVLPGIVTFLPC